MTINELKRYLSKHGVEEGSLYTAGEKHFGALEGIGMIDGKWYTYYCERDKKESYVEWPSENEAAEYILIRAEKQAKLYNMWKE